MKKLLSIFPILFLLQACAMFGTPTPETVNERLAIMEIGYQEVLAAATLHRTEGRLSNSQIAKFDEAFDNYERSRNAAHAALELADFASGDGEADKVAASLVSIRALLAEVEP